VTVPLGCGYPKMESRSASASAPSNVLAQESDPQLSYALLLARTSVFLKSPKHRRETMLEFRQDWANFSALPTEPPAVSARNAAPPKITRLTPIEASGTF